MIWDLTIAQVKAARALLGWSSEGLGHMAGLSRTTITKYESGAVPLSEKNEGAVFAAFTRAGVIFIPGGVYVEPISQGHATDIRGRKFGILEALFWTGKMNNQRHRIWRCRCECGNTREVRVDQLLQGMNQSCGCAIPDKARVQSQSQPRHGGRYVASQD